MPKAELDLQLLQEKIGEYIELAEFKDLIAQLSIAEPTEKVGIVTKLIDSVMGRAVDIVGDVASLVEDEDALNYVVGVLDGVVKLPLYLEWLDGPIIKQLVKLVANFAAKYAK